MATILVTGATGFVGRHVVTALQAAGHDVRCATRAPERARASCPELAWVELDLMKPDTLVPALRGCSAAVFLVHGMGPGHGDAYPEHESAGARAFVLAAEAAGLRKIVYLGGVVPATGASRHLRSRQRTGEILRAGSVETIELRAAMIIGAGSASWVMVRDLSRRLPAMVLPRWLCNTSYPIGIDDVVHGIVATLALPTGTSRIYELPGPERVTHRDVLRRTAVAMKRRRLMVNVPVLTPRLSSYWIALVTRTSLAMAKELVEGVRSSLEPIGESLWDRLDHRPIPVDAAIRRALSDEPAAVARTVSLPIHVPPPAFGLRVKTALVVATIAFSLALVLRERVDPWSSTAAAAVLGVGLAWWALGDRMGRLFAVSARGVCAAAALGGLLVVATHGTYQIASTSWPELAHSVRALYASIDVGLSRPVLVLLTTTVVIGEEVIWRGVAIELVPTASKTTAGAISVALYVLSPLAGGVPLLIVPTALLGGLFAAQRLITGRITDSLVTHTVWSVAVFVMVPVA
jgi:uncharacterized protein YbjT (DUF2867 family)